MKNKISTHAFIKSPIGILKITSDPSGLFLTSVKSEQKFSSSLSQTNTSQTKILKQACKQLEEYFKGKRKDFDIHLNLEGTLFQKQVWRELKKIPHGKLLSYLDVAKNIKKPKAYRAVGSACNKNPFLIFIPCHRVLKSDNTLGGFALGLKAKEWLLKHESSLRSS